MGICVSVRRVACPFPVCHPKLRATIHSLRAAHMGNAQEYFVAGGIAGVVSRTVIAPIERVKILYQVSRASVSTSWLQLAPQIWREAVLTRTSRSLRAVRTGYAYQPPVYLRHRAACHALYVRDTRTGLGRAVHTRTGAVTGVAVPCFFALTVLCHHRREEGFLAFWKGNTAAVTRVLPYMSLTFLSYEEYRAALQRRGLSKTSSTIAAGRCYARA